MPPWKKKNTKNLVLPHVRVLLKNGLKTAHGLEAMVRGFNVMRKGPTVVFCPLLKISFGNPYLKILDLQKLFVVDAAMKKK